MMDTDADTNDATSDASRMDGTSSHHDHDADADLPGFGMNKIRAPTYEDNEFHGTITYSPNIVPTPVYTPIDPYSSTVLPATMSLHTNTSTNTNTNTIGNVNAMTLDALTLYNNRITSNNANTS